jgi:hypothetical protein
MQFNFRITWQQAETAELEIATAAGRAEPAAMAAPAAAAA